MNHLPERTRTLRRATHTLGVTRFDVSVAAGVGAWNLVLSIVVPPELFPAGWYLVEALLLIQSTALVLWRRAPLLCFLLVWGLQVTISFVAPPPTYAWGMAVPVSAFGLGVRWPAIRGIPLMIACATIESLLFLGFPMAGSWREWGDGAFDLITMYVLVFLGGALVASNRRGAEAARLADAKQHERDLEVTLAQERRRLAGELHDVAAHHLAGIVVQAAAIERLVDRDPAAAKQAAAQLRSQGKTTLNELRAVVGLLRDNAVAAGLKDLPDLVATIAGLGVQVDLDLSAGAWALPPAADAAAYRVAQQSISNALQHAPEAWIRVEVGQHAGMLELVVTNGPSSCPGELAAGGTGLRLMRERAQGVGGDLTAGPTPEGGWRVRLRLPPTEEDA